MSTLEKCSFCAEWIESGLEKCPLCGRDVEIQPEVRIPPFRREKPEELVANLRRHTQPVEEEAEELDEDRVELPSDSLWGEFSSGGHPQPSPSPPPAFKPVEDFKPLRGRRTDESMRLRPITELLPEEDEKSRRRLPRISVSASLIRTLVIILFVGAIGVGGIALAVGPGRAFISEMLTPEPTLTRAPLPTTTPVFAATLPPVDQPEATDTLLPTDAVVDWRSGCVLWDQVTLEDADQELCVYGEVKRWFSVTEIPFVAIFSEYPGSFALVDHTRDHPEIRPGMCLKVQGKIEIMRHTRPYIEVGDSIETCPDIDE
jgi:hypothetical protein